MKRAGFAALLLVAACGALVACGGGAGTLAADAIQTPALAVSASPAAFTFGIADPIPAPQSGMVAAAPSPVSLGLSITVNDPTVIGVAIGGLVAAGALRRVPDRARLNDGDVHRRRRSRHDSTSTGNCGRPDQLSAASQLVYPRPGATGVSPSIDKLYFAVRLAGNFSVPPVFPRTNLHLIAGAHETAEGSALQPDTPPPGSAPADPTQQGALLQDMSATVPPLRSATSYRTQIYDDACQPALLTGSFTTS